MTVGAGDGDGAAADDGTDGDGDGDDSADGDGADDGVKFGRLRWLVCSGYRIKSGMEVLFFHAAGVGGGAVNDGVAGGADGGNGAVADAIADGDDGANGGTVSSVASAPTTALHTGLDPVSRENNCA